MFVLIVLTVSLIYVIYPIYLYNAPKQTHYKRVSSINLEQEVLGGIHLLQSIDSITPKPIPINDIEGYQYYSLEKETLVATMPGDDKIILVSVYSDHTMSTAEGINVDSTLEDVVAAYGTSYYKRGEQGAEIIGYGDKISHRILEFWLYDNKVNMIRFSVDSIKM